MRLHTLARVSKGQMTLDCGCELLVEVDAVQLSQVHNVLSTVCLFPKLVDIITFFTLCNFTFISSLWNVFHVRPKSF